MELVYKIKMSADEYNSLKNLISETFRRGSRITQTGRGKRLYESIISEQYREDAKRLVSLCKIESPAVRDKEFTVEEIIALKMLEKYCMEV